MNSLPCNPSLPLDTINSILTGENQRGLHSSIRTTTSGMLVWASSHWSPIYGYRMANREAVCLYSTSDPRFLFTAPVHLSLPIWQRVPDSTKAPHLLLTATNKLNMNAAGGLVTPKDPPGPQQSLSASKRRSRSSIHTSCSDACRSCATLSLLSLARGAACEG